MEKDFGVCLFAYNSPSKWSVPFQLSVGLDSVLQLCNAIMKQSKRKRGPGRTCYGRSQQEDKLVHCPGLSQWFQPGILLHGVWAVAQSQLFGWGRGGLASSHAPPPTWSLAKVVGFQFLSFDFAIKWKSWTTLGSSSCDMWGKSVGSWGQATGTGTLSWVILSPCPLFQSFPKVWLPSVPVGHCLSSNVH